MDETKRDIYNRFGEDSLQFDPRADELKLLLGLGGIYLFWGVCTYIATLPASARACRTWVVMVLILMLICEVFLCLTETALPSWMPASWTEHEFASLMHSIFPLALVLLRCVSEYFYVDINHFSVIVLNALSKHYKVTCSTVPSTCVTLTDLVSNAKNEMSKILSYVYMYA